MKRVYTKWMAAEDRFLLAVDSSAGTDDCWPWTGDTDSNGYGRLSVEGLRVRAHRYAWERANGPIPEGMFVLHRCDNPPCCNERHLFLGTIKDNNRDRLSKGRNGNYACPGEANGRAKITTADASRIREMHAAGIKTTPIARQFGIDPSTVRRIVSGKSWLADACRAAAEVDP